MTLTIRSAEELAVIQSLIETYMAEVETLAQMAVLGDDVGFEAKPDLIGTPNTLYYLTKSELMGVYERRRDELANKLLNKGISVKVDVPAEAPYQTLQPGCIPETT